MDSDSDSDVTENVPPADQCSKLIDSFVALTASDEALAFMLLQRNKWSLEAAVEAYCTKFGSRADKKDSSPTAISVLSWNIDGISERNIKARTAAMCKTLLADKYAIVFLQEVVNQTLEIVRQLIGDVYTVVVHDDKSEATIGDYFTVTLVLTKEVTVISETRIKFPTSRMARDMLVVNVEFGKNRQKLCLINTHLESTGDHVDERKRQMQVLFNFASDQPGPVVFGGDLNARDNEISAVAGVQNFVDLWQAGGSREECRYTWDMRRNCNLEIASRFKPRCRFDRLYASQSGLKVMSFGLTGIERVKGMQCFVSDHWAIRSVLRFVR